MRHSITHAHVHPVIELRARQMRSALTPSEQKLWEAIRGGRLGVSFRRQVPLGRFIADFVAPAARLVVEVDGKYHACTRVADARRDRVLTRMGYRVLRLHVAVVEHSMEEAIARIREALGFNQAH